jgi:2-oxoisovalerate dehydrogenase E1 component alpha subunit
MHFIRPSTHKAIPTYRVLDQYGQVLDKETGVDTEDEEALQLYKNMVCCALLQSYQVRARRLTLRQ